MTFAVDSPSLEDVVVGRSFELSLFKAILSARKPGLIMLTGERGSGKTSLLSLVRQHAISAGWNVAPQRGESLNVDADTTEESFSAQLRTLIVSPSEKSFIEKSVPRASNVTGESSSDATVSLPIVEQMCARVPFLLLIDGFEGEEGFSTWFKTLFLQNVRASKCPLIVIVAERAGVSGLESSADQTVALKKIDIAPIREHFERLGPQLTPPIEAAELEVYINSAHRRPDLLNSLTRVLSLAIKTHESLPKT